MCANIATTPNKEKVVVLFGSPNKKGFTNALLQEFLKGFEAEIHNALDIRYIYSYDLSILPCVDCRHCVLHQTCKYNTRDGFAEIIEIVDLADTVIIATPVYFYSFPAPLKTIIDRFQQKYFNHLVNNHIENAKTKKGILIATCGQKNKKMFEGIKISTAYFFKCIDAGFTRHIFAMDTDHPSDMKIFD